MNEPILAQEPETSKDLWTQRYKYIRSLKIDTYDLLKKRLSDDTIAILDADEELLKYMADARSGDSHNLRNTRGACYGSNSIMWQFYELRLGVNYCDLPDTAVRHILVGGDTYFEHSPSVDCVGDVVRGVLQELYDLLDNEHPEKKVEFALQPIGSQKK